MSNHNQLLTTDNEITLTIENYKPAEKRVFIAGIDGYLGWSLAQYLTSRGFIVGGCDNGNRRKWVKSIGSQSAVPIFSMSERLAIFSDIYHSNIFYANIDITKYEPIRDMLEKFQPDCIVHFAEMPSAPFSMIGVEHATLAHTNNLIGTLNILYAMHQVCPEAHLLKLGSMGEYGTPNISIPEGFIEIKHKGRKDILPFPRQAGSWYHQTKVHDSNNIMMACKLWGLRSTNIMQGVVFGTKIEEMSIIPQLRTRMDFDQCFGTVINRYCAQAVIGEPLTPYGQGNQLRGFLPLKDSMQCLAIAIKNPPRVGEYRVFNQFEEIYSINGLAKKVQMAGKDIGLDIKIVNIENPRKEADKHYYKPEHKKLLKLGYKPTHDIDTEIKGMLLDLINYRDRIAAHRKALIPYIRWDGTYRKPREYAYI